MSAHDPITPAGRHRRGPARVPPPDERRRGGERAGQRRLPGAARGDHRRSTTCPRPSWTAWAARATSTPCSTARRCWCARAKAGPILVTPPANDPSGRGLAVRHQAALMDLYDPDRARGPLSVRRKPDAAVASNWNAIGAEVVAKLKAAGAKAVLLTGSGQQPRARVRDCGAERADRAPARGVGAAGERRRGHGLDAGLRTRERGEAAARPRRPHRRPGRGVPRPARRRHGGRLRPAPLAGPARGRPHEPLRPARRPAHAHRRQRRPAHPRARLAARHHRRGARARARGRAAARAAGRRRRRSTSALAPFAIDTVAPGRGRGRGGAEGAGRRTRRRERTRPGAGRRLGERVGERRRPSNWRRSCSTSRWAPSTPASSTRRRRRPRRPAAPPRWRRWPTTCAPGAWSVLIVAGANPAYDAPAAVNVIEALAKVPFIVSLNDRLDETSRLADLLAPGEPSLRMLERCRAAEGHRGRAAAGGAAARRHARPARRARGLGRGARRRAGPRGRRGGHRAHAGAVAGHGRTARAARAWRSTTCGRPGPRAWRSTRPRPRSTRPGTRCCAPAGGRGPRRPPPPARSPAAALALLGAPAAPATGLELQLYPHLALADGRGGNNGWLHELPDPVTRLTWGGALSIAPRRFDEMLLAERRPRRGRHGQRHGRGAGVSPRRHALRPGGAAARARPHGVRADWRRHRRQRVPAAARQRRPARRGRPAGHAPQGARATSRSPWRRGPT